MQSAGGLLAGIFALPEQPEHAPKLLPGPRGGQFPAALGGEVHDVAPRLGGLGQPSLLFEQEGAGIDRDEIPGFKLMRAAPVGERAFRIAPMGLDLAPVPGQPRVVGAAASPVSITPLAARKSFAAR